MMKKVGIFVLCACFMSSMTVNASGVTAREVQESAQKESEESTESEQIVVESRESEGAKEESLENESQETESQEEEKTAEETPESGTDESEKIASADETEETTGTSETEETSETDETEETSETDETEETEETQMLEIPDVTGMNYQDADVALEAFSIEVLHTFTYSDEIEEDVVISQSVSGSVAVSELSQITLEISAGPEKTERATNEETISIDGDFSDWSDKPFSWEYGYDNSNEVWNGWFYVNGKAEQCEGIKSACIVTEKMSMFMYSWLQLTNPVLMELTMSSPLMDRRRPSNYLPMERIRMFRVSMMWM